MGVDEDRDLSADEVEPMGNTKRTAVLTAAVLIAAGAVSGCSGEQVKRATYDALHDKECIDKAGYPDCDPNRPSYDQYKRDRSKATGRQDN